MTTDTRTTLLRLALAEKKCYDCGGKGFSHDLHHEDGTPVPGVPCIHCKGTGRVPLIPGLREGCAPCDGIGYWGYTKDFPPLVCKVCGGRGWVVTTNSETIARGLWPLLENYYGSTKVVGAFVGMYVLRRASGHDAKAWEAAARALEEAGLVGKETP